MKQKSRRVAEHMHIHYFYGEGGRCTCGQTLDELLADQEEKTKRLEPIFKVFNQ